MSPVAPALPSDSQARPRIVGIVGSGGAYGRWLTRFFRERMGLEVIGRDPASADSVSEDTLIGQADVLVFSAPIRITSELIADYVRRADGRERGKLWLDVTSVKSQPVAAMLDSQAEVAGLHPMTAPPKAPTLKGRVMVVCEARLQHWRGWLHELMRASQAECVQSTPDHHDRVMALVQAMVHATHLSQAGVLRHYMGSLGGLDKLMPYRSTSFEMDTTMMARILSLNPAIYEDIQFGNAYVREMLEHLLDEVERLHDQVSRGDDAARAEFREHFLHTNHEALGETALAEGNYSFERLSYLLADLTETHYLSVHLPEDRSGSLRVLLHIFERHGVSLSSIHSSRTPDGEVHFRIGFQGGIDPDVRRIVIGEIEGGGTGRVLSR
ncbi:MAG: prephenate dehydrogenase [Xanthomonadaceae bacterium]|jgi:prephenate dehydrogenase|nr:prephenate dehydrogenase [Xanthomonadaceae bacterium]